MPASPIGGYGRILTQFHAASGLNVQLTWPGSVLIRYAMFGNIAFNRSFGTILMCLSMRFDLDSYPMFTRSIDGNFNLVVQWFECGVVVRKL